MAKDNREPFQELASAPTKLPQAKVSEPLTGSEPNFIVSVKDAPTLAVFAKDEANAFEVYKKKTGMLNSINPPVVSPVHALAS